MSDMSDACRRCREEAAASWPAPAALGPEAHAHANACAACRAELDAHAAFVVRSETRPWASLLRRTPRFENAAAPRRSPALVWAPALALAAGVFLVLRRDPRPADLPFAEPEPVAIAVPPPEPVAPAPAPAVPPETLVAKAPPPAAPRAPSVKALVGVAPIEPEDPPQELLEKLALLQDLEVLEDWDQAKALADEREAL